MQAFVQLRISIRQCSEDSMQLGTLLVRFKYSSKGLTAHAEES